MKGPIQKNQLPNGRYVIGKDIPVGTYDLELLHGNGFVHRYASESDKYSNYSQWLKFDKGCETYCINVVCREGEVLEIPENMVVGISRSNKVVLDL